MQPDRLVFSLRTKKILITPRPNFSHQLTRSHTTRNASDKLFADAEREEFDSNASRNTPKTQLPTTLGQHENWTGDESIRDAVLRMLVDKYKPLRAPSIITADEKLKRNPPKVPTQSLGTGDGNDATTSINTAASNQASRLKPRSGSWATEPLLSSSPTHKPWETTFKAPSDGAPLSIRTARLPPSTGVSGSGAPGGIGGPGQGTLDERLIRKEKEKLKKAQQIGRLSQALESTLDYRLGIKYGEGKQVQPTKPNPVSLKDWNSFVEDKIQKARSAGVFENVKGRGKPLVRSVDEFNPFIAREEFLMNRIVRRSGSAPPWVEVQVELETAAKTFRELLRQSWVRRAIRLLTMNNPPALLHKISLDQVKALRDPEWVKKELSYHETAIAELNSLVRKYNGLAPYHVRRSYYYSRELEITRMYETAADDIMQEIGERLTDSVSAGQPVTFGHIGGTVGSSSAQSASRLEDAPVKWRLRDLLRRWFNDIASKMSS